MTTEESIEGALEYSLDLYEGETVRRMVKHLMRVLEQVVEDPGIRIQDVELMTEEEREQVLVEWNDTDSEYPEGRCVHELFEEQVKKTPGAIAVVYGEQELTYEELNRRANQLGEYLRRMGVGPEVRVGICVERGAEMVVGILGILKAGGAYVPLDPEYPGERLGYMVEDAGLQVIVTQEKLLERLEGRAGKRICIDREWEEIARAGDGEDKGSGASGANAAYVIYTSGSTGRPKGVVIEHVHCHNMSAVVPRCRRYIEATDTCWLLRLLTFDIAVP